jgi:hypothetical protein
LRIESLAELNHGWRYNPLKAMPKGKCDIHVTAESVDVESDGLFGTPASRRWLGCFLIALSICCVYFAVFHHGRGPNIQDLVAELHPGKRGFVINLVVLAYCSLIEVFILAYGVRHLLPFGERLHADRTNFTWSRIRWLSFGQRWTTRSIPISEVVRASYAIVYKSKGVHGILIETYGDNWKTFWGIEAPEANRILRGLKGLGVNIQHDPEMRESIRETLRDRRAEL